MNAIDEPRNRMGLAVAALSALAMGLSGLFFVIGGAYLVSLKGSPYFLVSGLLLVLSSFLLFRRRRNYLLFFCLFYVLTLFWSLWDAGLDFWPLISRLMVPSAFLMLALAVFPAIRAASALRPFRGVCYGLSAVVALGLLAGVAGMFFPHAPVRSAGQDPSPAQDGDAAADWDHYGRDAGGSRFAALSQINRHTVAHLKQAWVFHTGDVPLSPGNNGAEDQETPLQVGDKVFLCTPHNNIIALDADTGAKLWEARVNAKSKVWMRCRGLGYFDASKPREAVSAQAATAPADVQLAPTAPCQRRVFVATIDDRLIAVDADDGKFCPAFGRNGTVDLHEGLGNAPDPQHVNTSGPTVAGTTVVVGGRIADNVSTDMPGGVIRGYDVMTGALRWAFDPRNPDPTHVLAPGESYRRSSANSWAPMSYDPKMNVVFIPMGSSSVDLWGVDRTAQDHRYATSLLALDATTGRERWHYQTVHNDLWDFDIPMQPTLIDVPVKGRMIPAVVFGTKAGQIYVLDRATGKPLTEVKEVPVPKGTIPGEHYPDTQPLSVGMPQIGVGPLTESDMWGVTPFDQLICRIGFKSMRYNGLYTPPGTDLSLSFPGSLGGMNWGGISADPNRHYIFVNDMRLGLWVKMTPTAAKSTVENSGGEAVNTGMGAVPMKGTPYSVDKNRFMSPFQIPCQKPPYGTLSAIDMLTHKIVWQVPVGTVRDTGPFGVKLHMDMPIGMPTLGGTLATKGGLVFIAGTQDYYLRAYDSSTGREVWKARLPVGSQGGPMTYLSPKTHKQYVLISAGGARQSPDRGDYVVAYALAP